MADNFINAIDLLQGVMFFGIFNNILRGNFNPNLNFPHNIIFIHAW